MAIELILKVHKKFNPLPILQNSENDNIRLVYATKKRGLNYFSPHLYGKYKKCVIEQK